MDDETRFNRQPNGTFGLGNLANPGGRPVGLGKLVRTMTDDGKQLVDVLVDVVMNAERPRDRIAACELLLTYGWGRPTQALQVSGTDGEPIRLGVRQLTDAELATILGVVGRQTSLTKQ